jgi:hypothetical protein
MTPLREHHARERGGAARNEVEQLGTPADLHRLGIDYWLVGGWAIDVHAGAIARPRADLNIALGG